MKDIIIDRQCLSASELEAYLAGQLNGEERQSVENHLLDCPLCSIAVEGFEEQGVPAELATDLSDIKASLAPKASHTANGQAPKARSLGYRWMGLAASLAVLILAAWWLFPASEASSPRELFYAYYQPIELEQLGSVRSADGTTNPLIEAQQAYEEKRYEQTIALTDQYLAGEAANPRAMLIKGCALLAQDKATEAVAVFQSAGKNNTLYAEDISWYLALAYLQQGNTQAAASLLDQLLLQDDNDRQEQIERLRDQLNR